MICHRQIGHEIEVAEVQTERAVRLQIAEACDERVVGDPSAVDLLQDGVGIGLGVRRFGGVGPRQRIEALVAASMSSSM